MVKKEGSKNKKDFKGSSSVKSNLRLNNSPKESSLEKPKKKRMTKAELEELLINNFINLQKVLTNLSIKFEDLSKNISKLLELFEISAKSFAENISEEGSKIRDDKQLLEKLDSLLDQNKTIAKGIVLMEERIKQRNNPSKLG